MSNMNGNPHYGNVTAHRDRGNTLTPTVNAALALAYEQRTANLIAYVDKIDDPSAAIPIVNEIKSRLGLNEGATQ